eukprot:5606225-Prymnesium_polylepis.1
MSVLTRDFPVGGHGLLFLGAHPGLIQHGRSPILGSEMCKKTFVKPSKLLPKTSGGVPPPTYLPTSACLPA